MGKKGIVKFAAFYIGNDVEIVIKKVGEEPVGFYMKYKEIIEFDKDVYNPTMMEKENINFDGVYDSNGLHLGSGVALVVVS